MRIVHTASALLIGNELLSGKVQEQNLHALATTLRALGIHLKRASILEDDVPELVEELRRSHASSDLVITSGGVGPTHDDVTFDAVARAFGLAREPSAQLQALLTQLYRERLTPAHLQMANIPAGAELLCSPEVSWPIVVCRNVWILPGVPELFRMKLLVLREHVRGAGVFHTRGVFTKLDEGVLKDLLDRVVAAHPGVEVGSYPKWFDPSYTTKITLDSRSPEALDEALRMLLALLPAGEPQRVQ